MPLLFIHIYREETFYRKPGATGKRAHEDDIRDCFNDLPKVQGDRKARSTPQSRNPCNTKQHKK